MALEDGDDIAVGAALGVACGLVFWLFNFAYAWLSPIIGGILPGLASILYPLWYFSGTLAVIILRKPGAAVYVNLVGSAAEMLLGNQFSFGFASAALQGVFAELPISMTSGALVALEYGVYLMLFRYQGVSFLSPRGVIHMISELVGGVLIAGLMSWYICTGPSPPPGRWIVSLPDGRGATMPTVAGDRCLRSAVVRMPPVDEHPGKRPAVCLDYRGRPRTGVGL